MIQEQPRMHPEQVPESVQEPADAHSATELPRVTGLWFYLLRLPELALAIIVGVLTIFLNVSVISRYFLGVGITWSDEAARVLFAWVVFGGMAVGLRHRGHVGVELLVDRMGPRLRRLVFILQDVLVLIFSLFWTWQSIPSIRFAMRQRLPALQISIAWLYAAVVFAGVLMVIYSVANLIDTLRGNTPHADAEASAAKRHAT